MLTEMFHFFDGAADSYGAEKIATVGDSYCDSVFPSEKRTDTGVRWANATVAHRRAYRDVVGVFVGYCLRAVELRYVNCTLREQSVVGSPTHGSTPLRIAC